MSDSEDSRDASSRKRVKKTTRSEKRTGPNILITGTPGTGKSSLCQKLKEQCKLNIINVGEFAKDKKLLGDYDEELDSHELDEDRVIDELEDVMAKGNNAVDHHDCEFFPQRWFDAVFVLRTDNTKLYDRLAERKYSEQKIKNNMESEIFQTILDEAKEAYDPDIVHEIRSDALEDLDKNVNNIAAWIKQWTADNSS